jgi:DNA-binding MarR family transcriptional regulator
LTNKCAVDIIVMPIIGMPITTTKRRKDRQGHHLMEHFSTAGPPGAAKRRSAAMAAQNMARIVEGMARHSKRLQDDYGVSGPQLLAIHELRRAQPLTVSELAARMNLHASTVCGILDRLEERNLVVRERDAYDHRVVNVTATPTAWDLALQAPRPPRLLVRDGLASESEERLRVFLEVTASLAERICKDLPDN